MSAGSAAKPPARPGRSIRASALQALIGLAISALSLWLLLRQLDLAQVRTALAGARLWLLIPAVTVYILSLSVRAWRWSVLVSAVRPIGWRRIWPVTAIGYMGNVLLPARLGELVRAGALRKRGVTASAALGTIATERVLDGLATVGLLLLLTATLPATAPDWLTTAMRIAAALFVGALLALATMLAARPAVARGLAGLVARNSGLRRPTIWLERFLDGLVALRSPQLLARAVGITVLGWGVSVIEYWLVLRAFVPVADPLMAAFAVSAVGLSTAIPSAPGYVGTQELAGVAVLGLFGVPAPAAFSISVVFHLVEIIPVTVMGLVCLWREGLWDTFKLRRADDAA